MLQKLKKIFLKWKVRWMKLHSISMEQAIISIINKGYFEHARLMSILKKEPYAIHPTTMEIIKRYAKQGIDVKTLLGKSVTEYSNIHIENLCFYILNEGKFDETAAFQILGRHHYPEDMAIPVAKALMNGVLPETLLNDKYTRDQIVSLSRASSMVGMKYMILANPRYSEYMMTSLRIIMAKGVSTDFIQSIHWERYQPCVSLFGDIFVEQKEEDSKMLLNPYRSINYYQAVSTLYKIEHLGPHVWEIYNDDDENMDKYETYVSIVHDVSKKNRSRSILNCQNLLSFPTECLNAIKALSATSSNIEVLLKHISENPDKYTHVSFNVWTGIIFMLDRGYVRLVEKIFLKDDLRYSYINLLYSCIREKLPEYDMIKIMDYPLEDIQDYYIVSKMP